MTMRDQPQSPLQSEVRPPQPAPGSASAHDDSVGQLVERLSTQVSALVRSEVALATAEMKSKGAQAGIGVGLGGAGGVVALLGLGSLTAAAILGLTVVLVAWLAALIVGVVLMVLAGVLAVAGIERVRSATPAVPQQALDSTSQDIQTVKESIHR